jgi:hypothetical protein
MEDKLKEFSIAGVFDSGKWMYAALVDKKRTHYMPIMLLPLHKFYLDIISNPDSPLNLCGPYSLMLESWQALGIKIGSMNLCFRPDAQGKPTLYISLKLQMKNDVGTQIGIVFAEITDAVVLHAITGVPILVDPSILKNNSVNLPKGLPDEDILAYIEKSMLDSQNYMNLFQNLLNDFDGFTGIDFEPTDEPDDD